MTPGKQHGERLFVYCDTRELELRHKIGEYICETPPHVTFAKIYTDEPEKVYEVFDEVSSYYPTIPIVRNGIMMVRGHRLQCAARLDDVSGAFAEMQERIYRKLRRRKLTVVNQNQRVANGFIPHATFGDLTSDAPLIPAEFDIDTITLARTLPNRGMHHRNIVSHIVELSDDCVAVA